MTRLKILWVTAFTALSVILIEILYTRLFSAIYFSSFAFFIISLALFGTGLSGLQFSLIRGKPRFRTEHYILLFALSLPLILKLTLIVKIDFLNLFTSPVNLIFLMINFLALILPFFLGGAVLVRIFAENSQQIGKLYFYDLAGAAFGSLLIIPLISGTGPMKAILIISILLIITWYLISEAEAKTRVLTSIMLILLFSAGIYFSGDLFKLIPKIEKRDYTNDLRKGRIEHSKWSPINKIDVATFFKRKKVVWLDAGTQQSYLVKPPVPVEQMGPIEYNQSAIPYQLAKSGAALIIGSAGGYEVLCAYTNNFKPVFAVEMDPEICDIVENSYSEYLGDLFKKREVRVINDEGRHVLRKLKRKYNVIQMVNSHNSNIILSGGLSFSETYIYTVESFKDYWNHLNDDGFLSIIHMFGERMFTTALQALKEMGVEDPEKKFYVLQPPKGFNYFFMKKGDLNSADIEKLEKFSRKKNVAFSPFMELDNVYYDLAGPDFEKTISNSSVNISPVYDNSPYFNQPNKIG
ncbi:MAG: hypothetical protein KAS97_13155, partial [Candidatus Aminicenantes bacterium]|nr:hypothetical protein [Candidatus Aminicenantes bacterium]